MEWRDGIRKRIIKTHNSWQAKELLQVTKRIEMQLHVVYVMICYVMSRKAYVFYDINMNEVQFNKMSAYTLISDD